LREKPSVMCGRTISQTTNTEDHRGEKVEGGRTRGSTDKRKGIVDLLSGHGEKGDKHGEGTKLM